MKTIFLAATLILCSKLGFCQTQREMNDDAVQSYHKTDKKLGKVYNELLKFLQSKKEKELLIKSERAWINFRDAHAKYEENFYDGGSMQPMIYFSVMEELTKARIKQLEESLKEQKAH